MLLPPGFKPGHRGDVHDAAGPAGLEEWRGRAADQVRAAEVGREEPVPGGRVEGLEIGERDRDVPARVVDEHVEPAEVARRRLDRGRDRGRVGLIERDAPGLPSERLHRGARLARGVLALEVGDADVRARGGERPRDGDAERSGAAGHQRDAILEVHGESRVYHAAHVLSRGSRTSRSPSPSRFIASTVSMIARPGKVEIHHASRR